MSRWHLVMRKPFGRTALVVVSSVAALALAGCGAGQITQTDTQVAAVDGASADAGAIALRDAVLAYPEQTSSNGTWPTGSDVPVRVTIVNNGTMADTLEAVRTSAAGKVLVQGRTTIPAGTSIVSVTDSSGGAGSSSAGSSSSSASASAAPSVAPGTESGGQELSPLDVGQLRIVLVGTNHELRSGLNTELTFIFRNAGAVTMPVPILTPDTVRQHEG